MLTFKRFFLTVLLVLALTACTTSTATTGGTVSVAPSTNTVLTVSVEAVASAAEVLAENTAPYEVASDLVWDEADVTAIMLNGDSIAVSGSGVTVAESVATITSAGTYTLSGALTDGQIVVNVAGEGLVRLILHGVNIHNSASAAIHVLNAENVMLVLAENTENYVSDGATYVFENAEADGPNAAVFSESNLTIYGNGSLTVQANYNDGIASKDGLIIASGTLTVTAADDGIRGKDYVVMQDGTLNITAQGDGLKSDNEDDATQGYISIEAGTINITAGGDAIQAQTDVGILSGTFNLTSGGGSNSRVAEGESAKGIKAVANLNIDGGSFVITAADDALHSNTNLMISGGTYTLSSGDDGLHADAALTINGGDIQITQSYEGIESAVITINSGDIHVVASDDGINVAGGVDGSGAFPGGQGGDFGQDTFAYTGDYYLYVNGGYIVMEAAGDGVDVNGAVEMTNGVILVNGPTAQMNAALDYDASFTLTGGLVVAAGSSGMAQTPNVVSNQASVLIYFTATQAAGTLVHIQNGAGEDILTFAPTKDYQSLAFSSPKLVSGETYAIYVGGNATGTVTDGLYSGSEYQPGTAYSTFTVSSAVTTVGTGGRGPGRRP